MYKKNIWFILICITMISTLFGCQSKEVDEEVPAMIDVHVKISPENAKVKENMLFEVTITQGDHKVTDASSVEFEFGKKDGTDKEKIAVNHQEKGIYSLEKAFSQSGDYYLIPHVTARGMHAMPKKEFKISD